MNLSENRIRCKVSVCAPCGTALLSPQNSCQIAFSRSHQQPEFRRSFQITDPDHHTPWTDVECNVPTHDSSVTRAENLAVASDPPNLRKEVTKSNGFEI